MGWYLIVIWEDMGDEPGCLGWELARSLILLASSPCQTYARCPTTSIPSVYLSHPFICYSLLCPRPSLSIPSGFKIFRFTKLKRLFLFFFYLIGFISFLSFYPSSLSHSQSLLLCFCRYQMTLIAPHNVTADDSLMILFILPPILQVLRFSTSSSFLPPPSPKIIDDPSRKHL